MEIGSEHAAGDLFGSVQHVVVIVPVNADIYEAQHVAEEDRNGRREPRSWPWGMCSSSTMIVMMIASTPSLKASSLALCMDAPPLVLDILRSLFFYSLLLRRMFLPTANARQNAAAVL